MARKLRTISSSVLENIVRDSAVRVGLKDINSNQAALLTRLIFSGLANYFFISPDDVVDVGYLKVKKNPAKEELFAVEIIKSAKEGITNAETLYRYYKGDLTTQKEIKETMNNFVNELLSYSQAQNFNITKLTSNLRKGETENGI